MFNLFQLSQGSHWRGYIAITAILVAALGIFLCSSSLEFEDIGKDCLCRNIGPDVRISLRRSDSLVGAANETGIRKLLDRTKDKMAASPLFTHPDDIERVLDAMKLDTVDEDTVNFLRSWDHQVEEIKTSVMRLLASLSSSPLAPSQYSERFYERMRSQMAEQVGTAVLSSDETLQALQALIESDVNYEPLADDAVIRAVKKYLSLSTTKLYGSLKAVPERYTSGMDSAFREYLKTIPDDHNELVKRVAYADVSDEFLEFECGNAEKSPRQRSYSRFIAPVSEVNNPDVIYRMKNSSFPIGPPQDSFSEQWWVEHAVWQMLARESSQSLDNLAVRIGEFNSCGPA